MDRAVEMYRRRRENRLSARGYRTDDGEEETNNNNSGRGKRKGGRGNLKLPFGLCAKYGIEVGKDWTPKDAWDALAGKGITPGGEYSKLKGEVVEYTRDGVTYRNLVGEPIKASSAKGEYALKADFVIPGWGKDHVHKKETAKSFITKNEMMAFLRDMGITSFVDPDTGKKVNPSKMDLPRTVAQDRDRLYTDLVIGTRMDRYGHPLDGRGYTITVKDHKGRKSVLKTFKTVKEAKEYAKKHLKCEESDMRMSKDLKKYLSPKVA